LAVSDNEEDTQSRGQERDTSSSMPVSDIKEDTQSRGQEQDNSSSVPASDNKEDTQSRGQERDTSSSVPASDNREDTQSRGQERDTSSSVPVRQLVFDLTVETEHCAICPNVLGQGDDDKSRIFAFGTYRCVRFSLYLSLEAR